MTTGSSADHIFCLNFNSSNSTNKLSGSSYKYYWLWRLFFFFLERMGVKKQLKFQGKHSQLQETSIVYLSTCRNMNTL